MRRTGCSAACRGAVGACRCFRSRCWPAMPKQESYSNAKVAVLKALSGNPKMPFVAMLAQGFPRLTTITPDLLIPTGDESELPPGVHAQVLVRDDQAVIPNLRHIETLVAQALGV